MNEDFDIVVERETGQWYFAGPEPGADNMWRWYGPYSSEERARERREDIRAYTSYKPACHHDHNKTYAEQVR